MKTILLSLVFLFLSGLDAEEYSVYRVYSPNPMYNLSLLKIKKGEYYEFAGNQSDVQRLNRLGLKIVKTEENAGHYLAKQWQFRKDMGAYHTYQEMLDEMKAIADNHPDFVKFNIAGQTYEKRDIPYLVLTKGNNDKPNFVFIGNHHADEVLSVEVPLYLAQYIADHSSEAIPNRLLNESRIIILPMLNVDGHIRVEYGSFRRKNMKPPDGVDLNRNYSFRWGYDDYGSSGNPYDGTYRGEAPFSEEETKAVRSLLDEYKAFSSITYHSIGMLILYPFGFVSAEAAWDYAFKPLADTLARDTGYEPRQTCNLYLVNGDYTDWLYGERSTLAYTIELHYESMPDSATMTEICKEQTQAALNFMRTQLDRAYIKPYANTWQAMPDTVGQNYSIKWRYDEVLGFLEKTLLYESTSMRLKTDDFSTFPDYGSVRTYLFKGFKRSYDQTKGYFISADRKVYKNTWIQTSIPVMSFDTFRFKASWKTKGGNDYIEIFSSSNNGLTWDRLEKLYGSSDWKDFEYYIGGEYKEGMLFKFSWIAELATQGEFLYIDDLYPVVETKDWSSLGESRGTSFKFNNHPEGEYNFILQGLNRVGEGIFTYPLTLNISKTGFKDALTAIPLKKKPVLSILNPCRGRLQFSISLEYCGDAEISLYDITGKYLGNLYKGSINAGCERFSFALNTAGIYLLSVRIGKEVITKSVVNYR